MTRKRIPGKLRLDPAPLKECCVACGRYEYAFKGSWRRNWLGAKEFVCNDCKEASK